jgi:hypothetical protein
MIYAKHGSSTLVAFCVTAQKSHNGKPLKLLDYSLKHKAFPVAHVQTSIHSFDRKLLISLKCLFRSAFTKSKAPSSMHIYKSRSVTLGKSVEL